MNDEDPRARAKVAPHLLFAKAGQGRDVVFRGLLAPGAQTLTAGEDLEVIAHDRQGLELRNYRATFTVLDARHVTRAWLNDVLAGEPLSGNCPDAWREWVTGLAYQPLARFPQDDEERAARAEFDAQSRNDPPISDVLAAALGQHSPFVIAGPLYWPQRARGVVAREADHRAAGDPRRGSLGPTSSAPPAQPTTLPAVGPVPS